MTIERDYAPPGCRGARRGEGRRKPPSAGGAPVPYLPKGRTGDPTQWYWLRIPQRGRPARRIPTSPRTADYDEALRQGYACLADRPRQRQQRQKAEQVTVRELLGLFVDHSDRAGQDYQVERIAAWDHELGTLQARDVERLDLDVIMDRWLREGVTFDAGTLTTQRGTTISWNARD